MGNSVLLGYDTQTQQPISISSEARRRSTYVIGKPGTGKSTVLENIAVQDIVHGDGVCFLDPHGDSINVILEAVPLERTADVIYWDPKDIEHPFGLNPFFCENRADVLEVDQRVENFMSALSSLAEFSDVFKQAPRMSDLLRHLAYAFVLNAGRTFLDTPRFLLQQGFREQFYPALLRYGRPDILEYWQLDYDELPLREQRNVASSSLNKLRRFTTTTILQRVLRQAKNSINFREVMDKGQVVIVNLHNLGEGNAEVIGALVVWQVLSAAYSRGDVGAAGRRPFHLIADEFQKFTSEAIPHLIEEGRKFGVDAIIAHQHRGQLGGQTLGATLTAPNRIVFQVTGPDAELLAWEFDTTPPLVGEVTGQRPLLTLSTKPWDELRGSDHANPDVHAVFAKLRQMFVLREEAWTGPAYTERFYTTIDPRIQLAFEYVFTYEKVWPRFPLHINHRYTIEDYGTWANPYLYGRQQDRQEEQLLRQMVDQFTQVPDIYYFPVDRRRMSVYEREFAEWRERNAARVGLQKAINDVFRETMQRLGDLLAQPENQIKTESGQYEPVYGPPPTTAEMANRIVNELTHLPPYTAKCRIGQVEQRIATCEPPEKQLGGEVYAEWIKENSRWRYGLDWKTVEEEITESLPGETAGDTIKADAEQPPVPAPDISAIKQSENI